MSSAAPDPLELFQLVRKKLGIKTSDPRQNGVTEVARALGWDTSRAAQRHRRWEKKGALPDYRETWAMLAALGWIRRERSALDVAEDLVRRLDADEPVPRRDLERAATAVDGMIRELHHLGDRLREGERAAQKRP